MMKIDGSCHCGALAYEAEIDPEKVGVCHCVDCQILSGGAFRTGATAPEGAFKITHGTAKIYVKDTDAGGRREMGFCGDCGTHIYSAPPGDARKQYRVRVATARQRDQLPPTRQIWMRSAQTWLTDLAGLPGEAKQSPAAVSD
jgi:hypothetical protein